MDYFVLGDNRWRTATAWPPKEAEQQEWYFHSDGKANRLFPSGKLTRAAPTDDEPADRYTYDPADPTPNWMSFEQMQSWADVQTFQWDMKDIEARHDVVTYTSAPLRERPDHRGRHPRGGIRLDRCKGHRLVGARLRRGPLGAIEPADARLGARPVPEPGGPAVPGGGQQLRA